MNDFNPKQIKQADAKKLAELYTPNIRVFDISCIVVYFALILFLAYRLAPHITSNPWLISIACFCGFLFADFVSGFVHWAGDTWGSVNMPVLGKALIRPFREHHVDPKAITRHDFIETNGANCMISIGPAAMASLVPLKSGHPVALFAVTFVLSLILWVLGTNQFHKWAHADTRPAWASFLQRMHLILPPEHHAIHHAAPYNKYYCITVGWMNKPLLKIHFFQTLERLISAVTGLVPREDDIGKVAAESMVVPDESGPDADAVHSSGLKS